jgi:probable HAF family extracellular repeat protein
MTNLGTLGGTESYAFDINNAGQIVGISGTANGGPVGFLSNGSSMSSLGVPPTASSSAASGISEGGLIAGSVQWPDGGRPAIYKSNQWIDLGTLGGQNGHAYAVNDAGEAVGWSDVGSSQHAFLYSGGQMIDLNTLLAPKGWSNVRIAYDINNKGQIIGSGYYNGGARSFLLTPVKPADTTPPVVAASATPNFLWPPNGQMVKVMVSGTITDADSGVNLRSGQYAVVDEYAQVQPAGAFAINSNGTYRFSIQLPARRDSKDKDGRVYKIVLRAADMAGNIASSETIVVVPVSKPK